MTCHCTLFQPAGRDAWLCECGHLASEHDDYGTCFGEDEDR